MKRITMILFCMALTSCAFLSKNGAEQDKNNAPAGNVSFKAYGTTEGVSGLTKNILEGMNADTVRYIKLSDDGYRYYYREEACRKRLTCSEFTVTIKEGQNENNPNVKAVTVSVTAINPEGVNAEQIREFYFQLGKFVKVSSLFSSDRKGMEYRKDVYEVKFKSGSSAGEIAGWIRNIFEELKIPSNKVYVTRLGSNFYRMGYMDGECENNKDRYGGLLGFFKIKQPNCDSFMADIGSRGSMSIVEIYSKNGNFLNMKLVRTIYDRLSDIVKIYDYEES